MQEDFLHYIWKFKKFDLRKAQTVEGFPITIINSGIANFSSGPDFFNAKLIIGDQIWAGNVEIHIKSSDWYVHGHEVDPNYDNVILHVVWKDDVEIFRKDNTPIPTLQLRELVNEDTMQSYRNLLLAPNSRWINCEMQFPYFGDFELHNWLERMYFEKLQKKSLLIKEHLDTTGSNWEAVFFRMLAKNFGLKVNGGAFLSMAQRTEFKIVQKIRNSAFSLEALFFGQSGLLEGNRQDVYFNDLKKEYLFLSRKYQLKNIGIDRPKYFRLRPDNFPNIRLSQLASLYGQSSGIFSDILSIGSRKEFVELFNVAPSVYWRTHYNFEKSHTSQTKNLSDNFIDLLIINTVVPIRFYYMQATGTGDINEIMSLMNEIKSEKNSIIEKYNILRPGTTLTALHSQALLHMKEDYCDKNACLKCNMGAKLIKGF